MRWPWARIKKSEQPKSDVAEAVNARQKAEAALTEAHEQTEEIERVVAQSRWNRRDNHFADLIAKSFRGSR